MLTYQDANLTTGNHGYATQSLSDIVVWSNSLSNHSLMSQNQVICIMPAEQPDSESVHHINLSASAFHLLEDTLQAPLLRLLPGAPHSCLDNKNTSTDKARTHTHTRQHTYTK